MTYKNCPICKTAKENCICEKPFDLAAIPQHHLNSIARAILGPIKSYFQDPANQAKYEAWLEERKQKNKETTL